MILLCICSSAQISVSPVVTHSDTYIADAAIQIHDLRGSAFLYVDSSNKLDVNALASTPDDQFKRLSQSDGIAIPLVSYWLKVSVLAKNDINNWWLIINQDSSIKEHNAQNSYVDLYHLDSIGNIMEHQRTGLFVPRSEKFIKENPGINRLGFSARGGERKIIYLRVYNEFESATFSAPQLRNPSAGLHIHGEQAPLNLLSGMTFFLALLSLCFFLFIREKSYLFFGLYTICLSQHYLILHPDVPFIDWYIPEHPVLSMPAFLLLSMGSFIVYALFGRSFINLPGLSLKLDKIFKRILTILVFALIAIAIIMEITRRHPPAVVNFIFISFFIAFLIRIAFFKTVLVRFFLAGAVWLILFTILGLIYNSGKISLPFNPWPVSQIGQILIYSIGLAYKVRVSENARIEADYIRTKNAELSELYEEIKIQKDLIENEKNNTNDALIRLQSMQAQIIQKEKMASLGELTAGIAHEIQNPLNFVNNFSDLNGELADELEQEARKGNLKEVQELARDIKENEVKINHHGKRADAIVKNMLQHSRAAGGVKEPTNINALAEEYLRLAYHACLSGRQALRSKEKSFKADLQIELDNSIGMVNIIPQDMGRVLLNLFNNAFYAVQKKSQSGSENYQPVVSLKTERKESSIEITVTDNGEGIPDAIKEKIFQPFFTTKPTGEGTGLGLSLSYDIVKAHGGEINLNNNAGNGVQFIISLPG